MWDKISCHAFFVHLVNAIFQVYSNFKNVFIPFMSNYFDKVSKYTQYLIFLNKICLTLC